VFAKKVLIADDDVDLRAAMRALLEKEFEVVEAANGREAVSAAKTERPGLVLLDVTMPEMGGLEALGAIKGSDPAATVLMLTSETDIETAKKALELGAVAYVTKPFDMEFLRTEVRRLLLSEPDDKSGRPWRLGE
jgi:DNA-binding response OmpR family regulator